MTQEKFIQERLDSLSDIDSRVVELLSSISTLFDTYIAPSRLNDVDKQLIKEKFEGEVKQVYGLIGALAIDLRKEVKIVDDNIGTHDKNEDSVMILPISVDHKNTTLGERKLKGELTNLG